ncbi:MAG TPA: hypothetical protein VIZ61_04450 [Solirubrobacterales bacterium]
MDAASREALVRRSIEAWNANDFEQLGAIVGPQALASVRWVMRGEASGAPMDVRTWMVYWFMDDRISRIECFLDESAARAALEEVG